MKALSILKPFNTLTLCVGLLVFVSCSSNDDGNSENSNPSSTNSQITYSLNGTGIINGTNITISSEEDTEDTFILISGHVYFEDTALGTEKLVTLGYGYIGPNGDIQRSVELTFSAGTGSKVLGEFQTGSTGLITCQPTEYMIVSVDEEDLFYDSDGDMDDDAGHNLLSKNVVVTITEYEETTNDLGILTLAHIKGSIGGSGNQLFSNYFTSPTTDPGELFYNITANFEYNISED